MPVSVITSVKTKGDSVITRLAVRCGSVIDTRTTRTQNRRIGGGESLLRSGCLCYAGYLDPTSELLCPVFKRTAGHSHARTRQMNEEDGPRLPVHRVRFRPPRHDDTSRTLEADRP